MQKLHLWNFNSFLTPFSLPQDLLLRHNLDVDDNQKLQLGQTRFSALSLCNDKASPLSKNCALEIFTFLCAVWTISGTCQHTTAGTSTTIEELRCGTPPSSAQYALCYLSLEQAWNVQHSVDELELRHHTVDRQGLPELMITGTSATCSAWIWGAGCRAWRVECGV